MRFLYECRVGRILASRSRHLSPIHDGCEGRLRQYRRRGMLLPLILVSFMKSMDLSLARLQFGAEKWVAVQ